MADECNSQLVQIARKPVRRLSAEEFWDAISDATGLHEEFKIKDLDRKVLSVMATTFNQDFASSHAGVWNLLQEWGQTDREDPPSKRASMVQAASLMNHELILKKTTLQKDSRLDKLLKSNKSDPDIVEELFLATVSRPPSAQESSKALLLLSKNRERAAENLLWALVNRVDFVFNQ